MRLAKLAIALVGVAAIAFLAWRAALRPSDGDPGSLVAGATLTSGLVDGLNVATSLVEPYPCARLVTPTRVDNRATGGQTLDGPGRNRADRELRLETDSDGSLSLGLVADSRGVVEHLPRIRARFADRAVDLVVSLGGMGRTDEDIEAALTALTGPWRLLSLPGDRESSPAHERVTARLEGVVSGSRVRVIRVGNIAILLTLPGAPSRPRLIAKNDGCMYTKDDMNRLAGLLPAPKPAASPQMPIRVLLSHTPPRQQGPGASDRTAAGVHIGDRALTRAVEQAGISLALHALEARPDVARAGSSPLSPTRPVILGVGSADGLADVTRDGKWPPLAMLVTIAAGSVTWESVEQ